MKYNLSCPAFYDKENQILGKSKWDNYRYRFSDRFHVDLMDHISEFGAVRGLKLDLLCAMAGIPGKFDVSGDQVHLLWYDDKLDEIKEYCESDVLNTYWLYLKYELLKGNMLLEDYLGYLEEMRHNLPQNRSYTSIFSDGIKTEIGKYDSDY
ncbi:putative 3'-5' exonuclease related to the exonuclease domain of PolB [compost metagenome]